MHAENDFEPSFPAIFYVDVIMEQLLDDVAMADAIDLADLDRHRQCDILTDAKAPPCAYCGEVSKYRCPACLTRTCSLACVQKHKAEKGCDGKRKDGTFREVRDFDDATLHRDFRFLEGAARAIDGAARRLRDGQDWSGGAASSASASSQPPARQNNLHKQARQRGVQLELAPRGMARARENTTRYDGRRRRLSWRVELLFEEAGVKHAQPSVPEDATLLMLLRSLLEAGVHLDDDSEQAPSKRRRAPAPTAVEGEDGPPPRRGDDATASVSAAARAALPRPDDGQRALLRHQLRAFGKAGASSLSVYMAANGGRGVGHGYHELPLHLTLAEALRGKVVLEFPTLHVAVQPGPDRCPPPPAPAPPAVQSLDPAAAAPDGPES